MYSRTTVLILSLVVITSWAYASDFKSKYAGQEQRRIKSLSNDDIRELENGGGWGLAKAAELNGVPGPIHILEMENKIHLSNEQKQAVTQLYEEMRAEAIPLGKQLIQLEDALNEAFSSGSINAEKLESSIKDIESVRAKLRLVHLSAHLKTPDILSKHQIVMYNQLRGYDKDPCLNVPEGHNEQMWKLHNGCK